MAMLQKRKFSDPGSLIQREKPGRRTAADREKANTGTRAAFIRRVADKPANSSIVPCQHDGHQHRYCSADGLFPFGGAKDLSAGY